MAETLVKQPWSDSQLRELPVDFLTDSLLPVIVSANGAKGRCPVLEWICAHFSCAGTLPYLSFG